MVRTADQTATNAEASTTNEPGYCLKWSRQRADIGSCYPDAATAWAHANNRHPGDRNPPRGAMVYWTGGASGYGHIAVALGGGKVRSTDSGGAGKPATVDIGWPEKHWGLPYAGWADNVNEVTIPGVGAGAGGGEDMAHYDHAVRRADTPLKAGDWYVIPWESVSGEGAFKAGEQGCRIGGRAYSAVLHLTLEAPTGSTIRMRCTEYNPDTKKDEETNPQTEALATSGNSATTHAQIGAVKSGRRLRFWVACTADAKMIDADAAVLSW